MKKLMKAIVLNKYGSIKDLSLKEVEIPKINEDEVLLKLLFTSLNAADLDFINGHPLVRFTGLFKPGFPILGSDLVGVVLETGKKLQNSKLEILFGQIYQSPKNIAHFLNLQRQKKSPCKLYLKVLN